MTEISAAMVKQLRDATSAGMMDCKRALQETAGDFDAAVKLLREKGMASAAKRADRETTEGVVLDARRRLDGGDRRRRLRDRARLEERGLPRIRRRRALDAVFDGGDSGRSRGAARRSDRAARREHPGRRLAAARRRATARSSHVRASTRREQGRRDRARQGARSTLARQLAMHISFGEADVHRRGTRFRPSSSTPSARSSRSSRRSSRSRLTFVRRSSTG